MSIKNDQANQNIGMSRICRTMLNELKNTGTISEKRDQKDLYELAVLVNSIIADRDRLRGSASE